MSENKSQITLIVEALKPNKKVKLTKEKLIFELITNGVAWMISMIVSMGLHNFLEEKSIKNLWGLVHKKGHVVVDKGTFNFLNWLIIFVVGLFVFTYVERVMEKYMQLRKEQKTFE